MEQVSALLNAVHAGRVKVAGRALRVLTGCWNMSADVFVRAILEHLESGSRVFLKYERASARLLPSTFQASVCIREPEDDDDYDDGTVYVELIIIETEVVLICNTHEHEAGIRRLPH